jgi:hypothetical protein
MNEEQLLQAIRLLITHLNDDSEESTAPVASGLAVLRELIPY